MKKAIALLIALLTLFSISFSCGETHSLESYAFAPMLVQIVNISADEWLQTADSAASLTVFMAMDLATCGISDVDLSLPSYVAKRDTYVYVVLASKEHSYFIAYDTAAGMGEYIPFYNEHLSDGGLLKDMLDSNGTDGIYDNNIEVVLQVLQMVVASRAQ